MSLDRETAGTDRQFVCSYEEPGSDEILVIAAVRVSKKRYRKVNSVLTEDVENLRAVLDTIPRHTRGRSVSIGIKISPGLEVASVFSGPKF